MTAPVGSISGNVYGRAMLRKAFRNLVITQGHREGYATATIYRYPLVTNTGKSAYQRTAGTAQTPVATLAGLACVMDKGPDYRSEKRGGSAVELKEGEALFRFIDLPATTGVAANTLMGTDEIVFDSVKWRPIEGRIRNDYVTGISYAACKIVER